MFTIRVKGLDFQVEGGPAGLEEIMSKEIAISAPFDADPFDAVWDAFGASMAQREMQTPKGEGA